MYIKGGSIRSTQGTAILNAIENTATGTGYAIEISGGPIDGKKAVYATYTNCKKITPTISGGTFVVHTFDDLKTCLEAGANVKLGADITETDATKFPNRIELVLEKPHHWI